MYDAGFFCCFKQKTAYEMRISDWSSDVCSSDLEDRRERLDSAIERVTMLARQGELPQVRLDENGLMISPLKAITPPAAEAARRTAYDRLPQIGRASSRDRVWQYV